MVKQIYPYSQITRGEDTVGENDELLFSDFTPTPVDADTPEEEAVPEDADSSEADPKDSSAPESADSPDTQMPVKSATTVQDESQTQKAMNPAADKAPGDLKVNETLPLTSSSVTKNG